MTFLTSWEDFEMAAERLYLQDPMKVIHSSTPGPVAACYELHALLPFVPSEHFDRTCVHNWMDEVPSV